MKELKVFSGSSNPVFSNNIARYFLPGQIYLHRFPSGESYCQYMENIRGRDVFLIQSVVNPTNDMLMELLVMIDAAKRASAGRITAVLPYLGYLRQERKTKSRTPISAKLVANMIAGAGADRVLGLDFHFAQASGFFDLPVDHLYSLPTFIDYINKNLDTKNMIVLSPDIGGIKRGNSFAESMGKDFGFIVKKRINDNTIEVQKIVGDVKDKDVLLIDDIAESCGTLIEAAKVCKNNGAKTVRAFVTHPILSDIAYERLSSDIYLDKLFVTNSILHVDLAGKIQTIDIAPVFAKAIQSIHNNESITDLFKIEGF